MLRYPVAAGTGPLVAATLPALTATHWHRATENEQVYCQGRCFVQNGGLWLNLAAFERQPGADSRVAFALFCGGQALLVAVLSPEGFAVHHRPSAPPPDLWALAPLAGLNVPAARRFAGEDEQGWYWGAEAQLPAGVLEQIGLVPKPGAVFAGVLLKYTADAPGYGASCALESGPLDAAAFQSFVVVPA